jgi:hypothetical protein
MSRITGKNGQLKIGGSVIASITAWSINAKIPVAKATAMMDQFAVNLSLIREWTADVEGIWESAGANTAVFDAFVAATTDGGHQSGKITVDFYPDENETEKWTGDVFADFDIKVGHDKTVMFTGKLTGTGSLVRTP